MSEQIEWNCHNCDADNSVCDCKQEPVAWMNKKGALATLYGKEHGHDTESFNMPLYTHPSSVRRLSEDEKYKFIDDHVRILSTGDALNLINRVIDACGIKEGRK